MELENDKLEAADSALRGAFCLGCCKMFKRVHSEYRRYCSEACKQSMSKISKCEQCQTFKNVDVEFKDGTKHIKRVCVRCNRGSYFSKEKAQFQREGLNDKA